MNTNIAASWLVGVRPDFAKKSKTWIAHVDEKNEGGLHFFEKNNWQRLAVKKNGMFTYQFTLH